MAADPAVLPGGKAAGVLRKFRAFIQVYTAKGALAAPGGEGVGDLPPDSPTPHIECGVSQVDTVAGVSHLVSLFGVFLDGDPCAVQPRSPAHSACLGGQGAAGSFRRVDPSALAAREDLFKRRSSCFGERKYFSPASFIKISDKVHPASGLRDAEIPAVKHLPFHAIPQSFQRMEDGRKRPPFVMVEQAGNIFKKQIWRLPGFSQPGKLKEQGPSRVPKSSALSSS